MISIVILKYRQNFYNAAVKNIDDKVGIKYQLVTIDNTTGNYTSIAKAYNEAIKLIEYSYVVFMHEDVIIDTLNWGARLVQVLESDSTIGLIGFVGNKFKSFEPSSHTNNIDGNKYKVAKGFGNDLARIFFIYEIVC